jgi:tetratricopeptide (TPR) repeat protein
MPRTMQLTATILSGLLLGTGILAAQATRGEKALEAGDYAKAIAAFKESAAKNANKADWCHQSFLLAYAYYQNKQLPEALAVFDQIFANAERLKCNTWGYLAAWHHWRGRAASDSGRFKEAASYFAKAAELAPKALAADFWPQSRLRVLQPTKMVCYNWLGGTYFELNSFQEAAEAFNKAIEQDPQDADNYLWLAKTYSGLKKTDDALAAAKRGLELRQDDVSYSILGDVHSARKELSEAAEAYRKAAENNPKRAEVQMALGRTYYAAEDYTRAVEAFTRAGELAPTDPAVPNWLHIVFRQTGRYDEAIRALDKAIDMVTFVGVGVQIKLENGQPVLQRQVNDGPGLADGPAKEAGLKAGDAIIGIDGRPIQGWDLEKTIQSLKGGENMPVVLTVRRQGEAKPLERTLVRKKIVPKTASSYFGNRALLHRETGNRDQAVKDAELAYSLMPADGAAIRALAAVDIDRGDFDEARKLLSSYKNDKDPFARMLEATALAKMGDIPGAVDGYSRIPLEDARMPLLLNAQTALLNLLQGYVQERLDKARASESAGRLTEALSDYAEALKVADDATAALIRQRVAVVIKGEPSLTELPEEARKSAMHGDLLIKDGRFDEALGEYRAAIERAPLNPKLRLTTALIHGELKDYRAAIRSMNVFLQLSPDAPNARAAQDEIYKWEFRLEELGRKKGT